MSNYKRHLNYWLNRHNYLIEAYTRHKDNMSEEYRDFMVNRADKFWQDMQNPKLNYLKYGDCVDILRNLGLLYAYLGHFFLPKVPRHIKI